MRKGLRVARGLRTGAGWVTILLGGLGLGLLPRAEGQAPIATVRVAVNGARIALGGILRVDLTTANPTAGARADLYAAVLVPGGDLFFRRADGSLSGAPGPLAAGAAVSAGTTRIFDLPVPASVPAGTYTFLAAYVQAGSPLPQENLVSNLASVDVQIAPPTVSFQAQVRPIFTADCTICHTAAFASGSLDLATDPYGAMVDRAARSFFQSRSIPHIDPGRPDNSYLIQSLLGTPGIEGSPMPLGRPPLSPSRIETIRAWVAEGAPNN